MVSNIAFDKLYPEEYYSKRLKSSGEIGKAKIVADAIFNLFKPKSVVDFGCGVAMELAHLKKLGVEVLGIDKSQYAEKHACIDDFVVADLCEPIKIGRKFNLCLSFDFIEHPPKECEETILNNLVNSSDIILISSPWQVGDPLHFNEQPPQHWVEAFKKRGYLYDAWATHHLKKEMEGGRLWVVRNLQVFRRYPLISVVFTCKGRPALTELCLRRFVELMPQPYELFICYDGCDPTYVNMLKRSANNATIITNPSKLNRFTLLNMALSLAKGEYFMHLENDFYWVAPECLIVALETLRRHSDVGFVRFEYLPFNMKQFNRVEQMWGRDILWMKPDQDYQFNYSPHIRRFKFINGKPFKDSNFTKQPEQHHNEGYREISVNMTGDNFRHLGIYDEGGHHKNYYAERFTGRRGTKEFDPWIDFKKITNNLVYLDLFARYLNDNGYQRST